MGAKRIFSPFYGLAHRYVQAAIEIGFLPALDGAINCVDCGIPAKCYDHRDYAKPLDVEPVCVGCNVRRGPGANRDDGKAAMTPLHPVAAARIAKGLTQPQLAAVVGTKQSSISKIETGSQSITTDMAPKLADALGISVIDVLYPAKQAA